MGSQHQCE